MCALTNASAVQLFVHSTISRSAFGFVDKYSILFLNDRNRVIVRCYGRNNDVEPTEKRYGEISGNQSTMDPTSFRKQDRLWIRFNRVAKPEGEREASKLEFDRTTVLPVYTFHEGRGAKTVTAVRQ